MPFPLFDRSRLQLQPLTQRVHDMTLAEVLPLDDPSPDSDLTTGSPPARTPAGTGKMITEPPASGSVTATSPTGAGDTEKKKLELLAAAILQARSQGRPVIFMMGAHVIKQGLSRFVVDFIRRGWVTHLGMNGAGSIHDYELALVGATTESVAKYIRRGEFGLWQETGRLNHLAEVAAAEGIGLGEAVGRDIMARQLPFREVSLLAAAYEAQIPATVHLALGQDITHEHPNCNGAASGQASYTDFLVFAETVRHLEGGVFMNVGSAVMGPEVYLKALAMARNVARQEGLEIRNFVTANFDLHSLGADPHHEPAKANPMYYYRPWKTILVRTVADGGTSYYVQADHRDSLPALRQCLLTQEGGRA